MYVWNSGNASGLAFGRFHHIWNFIFFKIFKTSVFCQYIHCWVNFQPEKRYSDLKSRQTPFTYLWTISSHVWKIPPKVKTKPLVRIQMRITFYLLEIHPWMYTLRESWDFEDLKNFKIFGFLMLFCIQNGNWMKICFFGFWRSEHKILATDRMSAT